MIKLNSYYNQTDLKFVDTTNLRIFFYNNNNGDMVVHRIDGPAVFSLPKHRDQNSNIDDIDPDATVLKWYLNGLQLDFVNWMETVLKHNELNHEPGLEEKVMYWYFKYG